MGEAAYLRNHVKGKDKRKLNKIVHSTDPNKKNPFYDPTHTFDPNAQKVIDKVKAKNEENKKTFLL